MLCFFPFPFALAVLVAAASCSSSSSSSTNDSCDNACQSTSDSVIASCASTVETGFWGFTRTGYMCSGSNECHSSSECATADLEFDSDDGGTFHVTSTANGVFHVALPAGNYQACCKDTTGEVSTCQSISLADKQKRRVDEEADRFATCFFTVF